MNTDHIISSGVGAVAGGVIVLIYLDNKTDKSAFDRRRRFIAYAALVIGAILIGLGFLLKRGT